MSFSEDRGYVVAAGNSAGFPCRYLCLLIVTAGCTADKKPSKMETALANMAKGVVIPIEAEKRKNPLPVNADTLREGRSIYLQSYAICHGEDGHGHTDIGRTMYPPAMPWPLPMSSTGPTLSFSGLYRMAFG